MLKHYVCIAKAIEKLFFPHVEIVIHDIIKQKIAYIGNSFSDRRVGDSSILDDISFEKSKNIIGPYEKINFDGKKLKSITSILYDDKNKEKYLFCINFDLSVLENLTFAIESFIGKTSYDKSATSLFKDDWQEKINIFVYESLKNLGKTIETITKDEKKKLAIQLHKMGAFKGKNSTAYASKVLKISRASLYNYLNEKE